MNSNIIKTGIIALGAALITSCGNSQQGGGQQAAPPPMPVTTYTVEKAAVTVPDNYPGVVVPLQEVELRGEVGGYITGIFVKDGQKVSKGQRLYEIDRTNYQAAFNSAKANLEVAKANLARTEKDAERYTNLAKKEAIAQQRVDYALTDLANAKSQVAAAQASLTSAEANYRKSVIVSPLNGTIGISQVKLGALVTPGSTLLNTVSTNDPIAVDIAVNQRDLSRFMEMQKNPSTTVSDSIFSIEQNGNRYSMNGKIEAIDRAVDPSTGTITVRISFPNPNGTLVAGMTCNVTVLNKSPEPQLVIPHKAVSEQLGKYSVYVVGDSSKVNQQIVEVGSEVGGMIVIKGGLQEGDVIVSDGIMKLRPGAVVQPAKATDSTTTTTPNN
ncbi:efflux RND transporter periplasmic adaptor subunit [Albibacterium indicum]|uniref:efflux RND transporter periplasmic adaptor subunit n=1 Tax=Albibacterium indicum TaxID=2292082 RepID=UPI000E4DDDD9|nr:efflux RND transporter periplasmic adaptor subunit [Pedobacter indicus]